MRFSFLLPAALAVSFVHAAVSEDLRAFLKAHPGKQGVGTNDPEFLEWKSTAFTTNSTAAPAIPKAYIIQLKPGTDLTKRDGDSHSQFHKRAAAIEYSTRQEFKNPDLFFGLSIQVKDDANETTILEIPDVLKVWPVRLFPRPETRLTAPPIEGLAASARKASALPPTGGSRSNVNSVHKQTEVNRLHALGIKGLATDNVHYNFYSQAETLNSRQRCEGRCDGYRVSHHLFIICACGEIFHIWKHCYSPKNFRRVSERLLYRQNNELIIRS